jgi:hypothetical protein
MPHPLLTHRRSRALGAILLLAGGYLATTAGCGARTGLYAPETDSAVPCTDGMVALAKARPTVMFVLDRSGSMGDKLGQMGGPLSRWSILTSALSTVLPPVDMTMAIGALLFPAVDAGHDHQTCEVPGAPDLLPALGNVGALVNLMSATDPGGGTPTADAIDAAATALLGVRAVAASRALVLATDGGPNCNADLDTSTCTCAMGSCKKSTSCLDDTRTVDRIDGYRKQGLPTYVIGIQDSGDPQFVAVLNAMADAGGRPQAGAQHYYPANSADELTSALGVIRDQLGACTYLSTSVPNAGGSIAVTLDGTPIAYDPAGKEGWTWGDKANGEVILVGAACASVTANPSAVVAAEVKCAHLSASAAAGLGG